MKKNLVVLLTGATLGLMNFANAQTQIQMQTTQSKDVSKPSQTELINEDDKSALIENFNCASLKFAEKYIQWRGNRAYNFLKVQQNNCELIIYEAYYFYSGEKKKFLRDNVPVKKWVFDLSGKKNVQLPFEITSANKDDKQFDSQKVTTTITQTSRVIGVSGFVNAQNKYIQSYIHNPIYNVELTLDRVALINPGNPIEGRFSIKANIPLVVEKIDAEHGFVSEFQLFNLQSVEMTGAKGPTIPHLLESYFLQGANYILNMFHDINLAYLIRDNSSYKATK